MGHYSYVYVLVQRQRLSDALRAIEQTDRRGTIPELHAPNDLLAKRERGEYAEVSIEPVVERDAPVDWLIANPDRAGVVRGPDGKGVPGTIELATALSDTHATLGLALTLQQGNQWACLCFDPGWSILNQAMHESDGLRRWFFAVAAAAGSQIVLLDHDCADTVDRVRPSGKRTPVWQNDWDGRDETYVAWNEDIDTLAEVALFVDV